MIRLFIPYFPGSRQDRVMIPGEPLTVKVYAEIINTQQFDEVLIFDPHSEVTPALLDRVKVVHSTSFIAHCIAELPKVTLVSPDAGALKKIYRVAKDLGNIPVLECGKVRNVSSGALNGFKVHADSLALKTV